MAFPQKPTGLYVQNGWYLELPGLVSPAFETLSGLSRKTGAVQMADAGSNIIYKFSSQLKDYGQITLSRPLQGSVDDAAFRLLVSAAIDEGAKYPGVLVKLHFGVEVFRVAFEGLLFTEENYPDFNVLGQDKLNISYVASVDQWIFI